jgi:hypothetical protein
MASQNISGVFNGGYSHHYQALEQERYKKFREEQLEVTRSVRERAHELSKQTILRRRALEQKKLAMAKAEEDRRRKALEERHKQQQEATDRFRSAIYRNFKQSSSIRSLKGNSEISKPPRNTEGSSCSNKHSDQMKRSIPNMRTDRIILGHTVEMNTPSLEEVLQAIRGRKAAASTTNEQKPNPIQESQAITNKAGNKSSNDVETISLSPIDLVDTTPTQQQAPPPDDEPLTSTPICSPQQDTPPPNVDNKFLFPVYVQEDVNEKKIEQVTEELAITPSSSSPSLQDSLESLPERSPSASPDKEVLEPLDLSKMTLSPPPHEEGNNQHHKGEKKKIVGILKRTSDVMDTLSNSTLGSSYSYNSSIRGSHNKSFTGNNSASKRVRFREEHVQVEVMSPPPSDGFVSDSTPSYTTPRMKITLSHAQQPGAIRKSRSPKNGITLHSAQSYDDISHTHQTRKDILQVSPQLFTLPIDKTIIDKVPTDDEINVLWSQINAYFYNTKSPNGMGGANKVHSAPLLSKTGRVSTTPQPPVKLWRRRQQLQEQSKSGTTGWVGVAFGHHGYCSSLVTASPTSVEETRLLESIELLNEKLKGRVPQETIDYLDTTKKV